MSCYFRSICSTFSSSLGDVRGRYFHCRFTPGGTIRVGGRIRVLLLGIGGCEGLPGVGNREEHAVHVQEVGEQIYKINFTLELPGESGQDEQFAQELFPRPLGRKKI